MNVDLFFQLCDAVHDINVCECNAQFSARIEGRLKERGIAIESYTLGELRALITAERDAYNAEWRAQEGAA
ncbi:MAG TPA: hypothetical protein VFS13_00730 [Steroidobacteraceae bacterium]|nr:hypothetical protein [Steroidobacteraceae bacterium]